MYLGHVGLGSFNILAERLVSFTDVLIPNRHILFEAVFVWFGACFNFLYSGTSPDSRFSGFSLKSSGAIIT